ALQQYSSGIEIPDTRAENFYAISTFKLGTLSIEDVPIHPECESLRTAIGATNSSSTIWYRDMLLAPGSNASCRLPTTAGPTGSASREVWVDASGSDSGSGSKGSPFATLERAVDALEGRGAIYVAH